MRGLGLLLISNYINHNIGAIISYVEVSSCHFYYYLFLIKFCNYSLPIHYALIFH